MQCPEETEQARVVKDLTQANEAVVRDAAEDAVQAEAAWARAETACAHRADTKWHMRQAGHVTR